jgi:hypothetical protein
MRDQFSFRELSSFICLFLLLPDIMDCYNLHLSLTIMVIGIIRIEYFYI